MPNRTNPAVLGRGKEKGEHMGIRRAGQGNKLMPQNKRPARKGARFAPGNQEGRRHHLLNVHIWGPCCTAGGGRENRRIPKGS